MIEKGACVPRLGIQLALKILDGLVVKTGISGTSNVLS